MIVVSDTSPLLYLFLIDLLEPLPQLYTQIVIPETVKEEMSVSGTPVDFQRWAAAPPEWLSVRSVVVETNANIKKLDPGEQAAICLAKSLPNSLLLIDEKSGRKAAIDEGIEIIGVLGILNAATKKGLIDLEPALAQLQQTNFRISPELIQELLDKQKSR